jgi:hypothetical protein
MVMAADGQLMGGGSVADLLTGKEKGDYDL